MKIFLDTASVEEIEDAVPLGVVDGVATNPTLLANAQNNLASSVPGRMIKSDARI